MPEGLAAAYVGLSTSTFRQVVRPTVPPVRLTPGRIAWLREDLDAWLDGLKPKPAVDAARPSEDASAPEAYHARSPIAAGLANLAAKRRARRPQPQG